MCPKTLLFQKWDKKLFEKCHALCTKIIVANICVKIFDCKSIKYSIAFITVANKLSDRDAEIERGSYITNCARDTRFIINHHPTLTTYNIM